MMPKPEKIKSLKKYPVLRTLSARLFPYFTTEIFTNIQVSQGAEEMAQRLRARTEDESSVPSTMVDNSHLCNSSSGGISSLWLSGRR